MYTHLKVGLLILVFKISIVHGSDYFVILTNDSPTVRGGTVHFVAKLYDDKGNPADGSFKYDWTDNSIRNHEATHESKLPMDTWNVTYPATEYFPPGPYEVQVTVYKCLLMICYAITSQRMTFELTVHGSDYFVILTNDSPTVRGGMVHFVAKLYDDKGNPADGSFKYDWTDNSIRNHEATHESKLPMDTWNVTYPATEYFPPGPYDVQVTVYKCLLMICYPITSQRTTFKLTEALNGQIELRQKNKLVSGIYVSNADTVTYKVVLNAADAEYINSYATSILTYWFIDSVYFGVTDDYTFANRYHDVNKGHKVEALVIAGYNPMTTTAPTSTIVAPATTTTENESITTIVKPKIDLITSIKLVPAVNKTYGHFSRKFVVKGELSLQQNTLS